MKGGALLGLLLGLLPLLVEAQDGAFGSGGAAGLLAGNAAAWTSVIPSQPGLSSVVSQDIPLANRDRLLPSAMQGGQPPRFTLASKMRFVSRNPNSLGYCAKMSLFDNHQPKANLVEIGVRADVTDPRSFGVPRVYSSAIYGIDLGQGALRGDYGPFEFKPNTWYQMELRYLDDQAAAQLWIDGTMQYQVPIKLDGRIFVTLSVCGQQNGDQISVDFQNVAMGGFIPGGNGYNQDVAPNGDWNTNSVPQSHGLVMVQTDVRRHVRQDANFHGEGVVIGAQPKSWPTATALNTEYWFGQ
jgi:hypothetical protein